MNNAFYLFIATLMLTNCTNKKAGLEYTFVSSEFTSPDCEPEKEACLMLSINYPQFDKGDSVAMHLANRIVKNSILDNIGMGDVESTVDPSIEMVIEELNLKFEELKKEFNDYGTGWQADISSSELYRTDSILVLAIGSMTYFGGAHPNHGLRYYNFNRYSGRYLPISTFITDLKEFTNKAEVVFKKKYNIGEGTTYDDAGFNFLGDRFAISANYAYLGDSIRLHYNHYEISSYAAGDFEITVALE